MKLVAKLKLKPKPEQEEVLRETLEHCNQACRLKARHRQRGRPHNWSFSQLGQFVAYKARLAGAPELYVEPTHTSKACSC